jgi:hypothetical protein
MRARGGLGHTENLRDVFEGQALFIAKGQDRPLVRTDPRHCCLERVSQRLLFDRIRPRWNGRFWRDAGSLERDDWGFRPPHRVERGVMGDPEEPTRQSPRRIERCQVPERLDECVLCEIFSESRVCRDPGNQPDDGPLIPTNDLLYCGLRAGKCLADQPCFGNRLEINRYRPVLLNAYASRAHRVAAGGEVSFAR